MQIYRLDVLRLLTILSLLAVITAACAPPATATPPAPTSTVTTTPSPLPSATLIPSATPTRIPPALPGAFQTELLRPLDTPHTYMSDACQVIKNKWDAGKAAPGTVLMPIMIHSITDGMVKQADQISVEDFKFLMETLKSNGFESITTEQAAGFLENNDAIPPRSVLLIVDDRKLTTYYDNLFREYWQKWNWPVINAWISKEDTPLGWWKENAVLEKEGFVDHQAHGVVHNIPIGPDSSEEYMRGELFGAVAAFQQHYGKVPIAYIWPGGGFTPRAAEIAREAGYRLGFTINPRGPLMYNWVPLADEQDPRRPSYMPEGEVNDPLMVLPRYWDTDAVIHIATVIQIGLDAAVYAESNRAVELEYYDIVCKGQYGEITK